MVLSAPLKINTLLNADDITRIGLTETRIFYLVGKKLSKGLCRFVKRDKIKDAISTLLALHGKRNKVEDILLTEMQGLKVFTDQGIEYVPSSELPLFLTRYNQVTMTDSNDECHCEDMWRHICPHKIKAHLLAVREKIEAMVSNPVASIAQTRMKREVMHALSAQRLTSRVSEDDGELFVRVFQGSDFYGVVVIAADGSLSVQTDSGLTGVDCVERAIDYIRMQLPTITAEQWASLKQLAKGEDPNSQLLSKDEFEAIALNSEYLRPLKLGEEPSGSKILAKHFDTVRQGVIEAAKEKVFRLARQPRSQKLYAAIEWTEVEKLRVSNPGVLRKFQELLVAARGQGLQLSELIARPFSVCLIDTSHGLLARFSLSMANKCWQFERYINGHFGDYEQVISVSLDEVIYALTATEIEPEQLNLLNS